MARIALIDVLMFSLPFLIYGSYMLLARGMAPSDILQTAPLVWLFAAGCALLLVAMATLISFSGGSPGGTYHPPSFHDGVLKPGEID
jgi:hypothetical protein